MFCDYLFLVVRLCRMDCALFDLTGFYSKVNPIGDLPTSGTDNLAQIMIVFMCLIPDVFV